MKMRLLLHVQLICIVNVGQVLRLNGRGPLFLVLYCQSGAYVIIKYIERRTGSTAPWP